MPKLCQNLSIRKYDVIQWCVRNYDNEHLVNLMRNLFVAIDVKTYNMLLSIMLSQVVNTNSYTDKSALTLPSSDLNQILFEYFTHHRM